MLSSRRKGFTLVELLVYLTLAVIVSSITLYIYVNTSSGLRDLKQSSSNYIKLLSVLTQLEKQLFSIYMDNVSIRLKNGRLSFYTMVPVLYSGIVRAEYYFDKGEKTFHYEEYPYIDGRLGESGLKRNVLGRFDEVKFYALKDGTWTEELSEKDKTGVIKMVIDGQDHYLVLE